MYEIALIVLLGILVVLVAFALFFAYDTNQLVSIHIDEYEKDKKLLIESDNQIENICRRTNYLESFLNL